MKTAHRLSAHAKRKFQSDPGAIYRVMARLQPFTQPEMVSLTNPPRIAFEKMRNGGGGEQDFHTLACLVNIVLVRSEVIDPLCVETAKRAQDALMRTLDRHQRCDQWGFDGQALQDLPPALDLYEQILELSTPQQMHDAMRVTIERMNAGEVLQ